MKLPVELKKCHCRVYCLTNLWRLFNDLGGASNVTTVLILYTLMINLHDTYLQWSQWLFRGHPCDNTSFAMSAGNYIHEVLV